MRALILTRVSDPSDVWALREVGPWSSSLSSVDGRVTAVWVSADTWALTLNGETSTVELDRIFPTRVQVGAELVEYVAQPTPSAVEFVSIAWAGGVYGLTFGITLWLLAFCYSPIRSMFR